MRLTTALAGRKYRPDIRLAGTYEPCPGGQ